MKKTQKILKISEISKLSGVNLETIRYYEKIGVITPPHRAANGYRMYDPHILVHLEFIKKCRSLGFSLEDIKQLDELRKSPASDCQTVDALIASHLLQIREKITQLQAIETALLRLCNCQEDSIASCKAMQNLDTHRGGHEHDYYQ